MRLDALRMTAHFDELVGRNNQKLGLLQGLLLVRIRPCHS